MSDFDPSQYGPVIEQLLGEKPVGDLVPSQPNEAARDQLHALTVEAAFAGKAVGDPEMARACVTGLWLYHGYLDESHTISQSIHTETGSYWHGIMHRREPDFSNSKYWFRRVGRHPVFEPLHAAAARIAESKETPDESAAFLATQSVWDPFAFIDLCEACVTGRSPAETLCCDIQQCEWELLFDYCYRQALGH